MATPKVTATWRLESGAPTISVTSQPMDGNGQLQAAELSLDNIPWRVTRESDQETSACELTLEFGSLSPLQCRVFQVQLTSSARHIEVHANGVRRSLLGEDEQSEVYFGTFRGTKTASTAPFFDVSQEFKQADRDHDVLKCLHSLRIKFVSLTGDKSVLELTKFKCLYISLPPSMSLPVSQDSQSAASSAPDLMAVMAGLSMGGPSAGALNPQAMLTMVQQMMEREVEAKINRVLDAKLSALSQRLAFTEQMLLQVQQKSSAKSDLLEKKLVVLQQQVAAMREQSAEKEPEPGSDVQPE